MKTLQNNFTTPDQSKRLLELGVPADSADCWYNSTNEHGNITWFHMGIRYCVKDFPDFPDWSKTWRCGGFLGEKVPYYLPSWSVGRLIEIILLSHKQNAKLEFDKESLFFGNVENLIMTIEEELKDNDLDFSKLEE